MEKKLKRRLKYTWYTLLDVIEFSLYSFISIFIFIACFILGAITFVALGGYALLIFMAVIAIGLFKMSEDEEDEKSDILRN